MSPFRLLLSDCDVVEGEVLISYGETGFACECCSVEDSEIAVGSKIMGKVSVRRISHPVHRWRTIAVLLCKQRIQLST